MALREYTPPPFEIAALRVILPRRARQAEHPLTLPERARRVRIRIEENVLMIEGGNQADVRRLQHAVAEYVAGHVADAATEKSWL